MARQRITGTNESHDFSSLADLQNYIATAPKKWSLSNSVDHYLDMDWDLRLGYTGAMELARDGWLEGAKRAQDALKAFTPATPAPDSKVDFYGHMPHVPRFCAGAPDSMIRHTTKPQFGNGKVLTLYVPVNATADVDAPNMANFGLGVAQYINQLETDGTRVELFGAMCSLLHDKNRLAHTWRVKSADQPLDLAVLAFSIGHPAMFRRLGFALRERSSVRQASNYGCSVSLRMSDIINPPAGAVILNGMKEANTTASTPAKALEYIGRQIERAIADDQAEAGS